MKFPSIGNTLFLKDLDSSVFEDIFEEAFHADDTESKKQIDGYAPRHIRGNGSQREGHCHICDRWFRLKTSSYWYHMNYKHGINSRGEKYPEPQTRRNEDKVEGYCQDCKAWITLGTYRKNSRFSWLRHMQKQHRESKNKRYNSKTIREFQIFN